MVTILPSFTILLSLSFPAFGSSSQAQDAAEEAKAAQNQTESITLFSLEPVQLLLTFAVPGGIIAVIVGGTYEWIRYYFNKRSQQAYEMTKQKLDVISKSLHIYVQLVTYYGGLSRLLTVKPRNNHECLYFTCKILLHQRFIFEKFGSLQLDDIDAESVISGFGKEIVGFVAKKFNRQGLIALQDLVRNDADYSTFLTRLQYEKALFDDFSELLSSNDAILPKGQRNQLSRVAERCGWYSELILFEVNHIYKLWYNEEPRFYGLSKEVVEYLKEGYKEDLKIVSDKTKRDGMEKDFINYYNRIASFESPYRKIKKIRKIR